ncbi:RagB/SusD family nutrient uptake outer membrane protein [Salinimicrobium sp. TIG7-5_MAKvit]|uniref:RagB/SusD family nutrient uptake outer membrane protein n=1 Tax=Salinimicrobium sp. TIG7-5_MAKvit TaxID=3121289 RepID=UPI003C6DBE3A
MKALNKMLLLFCLLFAVSSCDDALEEDPQNLLKPETVQDYDELLNFGYPTTRDYGTQVVLDFYVEMMTDDMDIRYFNQDAIEYPIHPFSFESTHEHPSMLNGYDQSWKNFYQSIYYANVVVDNAASSTGNEGFKEYVRGEAMILRAFSYFKLINLYAKPYDAATAASDPGVPLKLDPTVQAESYTRNSVQEIYDQILEDLSMGISLMEANDQRITSKYKFTPISAKLLASRVALYMEDYERTIEYATEVIDSNSRLFDLSGNTWEFAQTSWGYAQGTHYLNENNSNVLFLYGSNEFYSYIFWPGSLALSDDLTGIFEPGDLRYYYFSYIKGPQGRVPFKFRPFPNRLGEPIRGMRVEEAYLNRAEAYAMTGRQELAFNDINYVRSFKFSDSFEEESGYYEYTTTEYPNEEAVIAAVREERRRELFGEFHRWYDLRRYGMPEIIHQHNNETYVLPQGDPRYILQIPQMELDYNSLMEPNPR